MTTRRHFLETLAGGALVAPRLTAQSADARLEVLLGEPGATIAPEIYSHFVENLGGVIYDGIWVGPQSSIANEGGIRKQLIDALRKVKPGAIRWPGGCFADQYDWHDGTGPRDKRPRRTNFWVDTPEWAPGASASGPQHYDPNAFGTAEFVRFCELAGGQPYIAANLRSLPAQDFWRWVEYCNSPTGSTTLAELRAADGHPAPMQVRFWGVGNESWGCGGNFQPDEYATEYSRYAAWVPSYGVNLALVASGASDDNVDWTRRFLAGVARGGKVDGVWGLALHHYAWNASSGNSNDWNKAKGDALKFDAQQYYSVVREADLMESLIAAHWAVMSEYDPQHHVKLVVDEWGAWHEPGTEPFPEALLGQQNTMRDAVIAGLTLDTFNRHADKIGMANVAQLVNNLQSLFFAHEDRFAVTPTYHVFDMYSAHQGAQSVRTVAVSPSISQTWAGKPVSVRGLNGSASLKGKVLTVTASNPSYDQAQQAEIVIRGGSIASARGWLLAASDVHAHNDFANPRAVEPKQVSVTVRGPAVVMAFPAASVAKLELTLG
jgi:alpha-L-arabinofuranosidase